MMQLRFLASILGGFLISSYSVYAASFCGADYTTAVHTIHFDYNTSTNETSVITPTTKSIANTTFIASEDGYCPNGYVQYTRNDNYVYPIMEEAALCAGHSYPANGKCTEYGTGQCSGDRYNSAINDTTFIPSEDGYCPNNYTAYTRTDDYIYPLVLSNTVVCGANQYPAGGNCTSYSQSTCPSGYHSYSLNANTIAQQTNDVCPSNYGLYTTMTNCDVRPGEICADLPTIINLFWYDGINESPTQSTCQYNQQITLPPTPVRPGYVFGGWRVKTNN